MTSTIKGQNAILPRLFSAANVVNIQLSRAVIAGAAERVTVWSAAACVHTGCDELPERVLPYARRKTG